jgi:hypothetical protein
MYHLLKGCWPTHSEKKPRKASAHPASAESFDDPVMPDDIANHGEGLHWQCAHCDENYMKLLAL